MEIAPIYVPRESIADFIFANQQPVLMNISWYYDAVDSKGNVRMPTAAEVDACENKGDAKVCGGHVILLVGYLPSSRSFIFRNSWGAKWGQLGYGAIPEDFINQRCESCRYLGHLDDLSPDDQDLVKKASLGVTAELHSPAF